MFAERRAISTACSNSCARTSLVWAARHVPAQPRRCAEAQRHRNFLGSEQCHRFLWAKVFPVREQEKFPALANCRMQWRRRKPRPQTAAPRANSRPAPFLAEYIQRDARRAIKLGVMARVQVHDAFHILRPFDMRRILRASDDEFLVRKFPSRSAQQFVDLGLAVRPHTCPCSSCRRQIWARRKVRGVFPDRPNNRAARQKALRNLPEAR